ncbi:MAG: rhomboid family intramembrane serine protease [Candidatus Promineifilaceae bacterium]|nr:rhomboid family intramembrane serine protease [Candidatus Promineifilaceae bacterium]
MIPLKDVIETRRTPVVTIIFLIANVLIFLWELYLDSLGLLNDFILAWGVIPRQLLADPGTEWFTLFSAMFMHGGWAHLLGNMLYLWIFGDNVEDRLGHVRFAIFYLLSGLLATAAQVAVNPGAAIPNIGASGAIAGVLGGYLLLYPRTQIVTLVFRFIARVPAIIVLGFWFVYQFFFGIASLSNMDMQVGGVAFFAHVGGFLAGMLLIIPFQAGLDGGAARAAGRSRQEEPDEWNF